MEALGGWSRAGCARQRIGHDSPIPILSIAKAKPSLCHRIDGYAGEVGDSVLAGISDIEDLRGIIFDQIDGVMVRHKTNWIGRPDEAEAVLVHSISIIGWRH